MWAILRIGSVKHARLVNVKLRHVKAALIDNPQTSIM